MVKPSHNHDQSELIESRGAWSFVTYRRYRRTDGSHRVWQSRYHRKNLAQTGLHKVLITAVILVRCMWMPRQLNWWIGVIFAVGSILFAVGSVLALAPEFARVLSLDSNDINVIFHIGSIPFTAAAYLQLFQAANASERPVGESGMEGRTVFFGWEPRAIGWLSCMLQFVGTLLFNIDTFDAMLTGLDWLQQDLAVWVPDFAGSILFLASGYLAFVETCHARFAWQPGSISWWVTFTNLLGCVAFMISAIFAFVPPQESAFDAVTISIAFTLIGALGFLTGSLLMLIETAQPKEHDPQGDRLVPGQAASSVRPSEFTD